MRTIAGVRIWAAEELRRAKVDAPALTADLLLGFVLGCDRVWMLSHGEDRVPEHAWIQLRGLISRRSGGEPFQYLTGEQEFFGLTFHVTPDVLIPRPETEILVEKALELMRREYPRAVRFADIGAGSGCIAVTVAHQAPYSLGYAVDLSAEAIRVAQRNAVRHRVAERLLFVRSSLMDCFPQAPCLDFILCNPPYVALDECDSLPVEVRDHEPHDALFGGASGLDGFRGLIPEVPARLRDGGWLLLEIGAGQALQVGRLVENAGLDLQGMLDDLQGIPRCVVARKTSRET